MILPKYKIFLFLLLAFIFGIAVASFVHVPFFICYLAILFSIILIIFGNNKIRIFGFFLILIILGIWRYDMSWPQTTSKDIQFHNNQKIILQGTIEKIDNSLNKKQIVLRSESILKENIFSKIKGKVLIYTPIYSSYRYGDKLEISCQLFEPENNEQFAYHEYLARYDIYSTCFPKEIKILSVGNGNFFKDFIFNLREKIKIAIDKNFTEPEGSILSAILLGVAKEIPQETRNWFSLTGTAHVLSISGLHVSILANLLLYLATGFLFLSRPKAFYFIILILIFYIILAGAPASAIRAGIMGGLLLLAEKIGRRNQALNALILAAAIMLFINPKLFKNDVGFQLSFASMLGITLLSEYFQKFFYFLKFLPEKLKLQNSLATTFSAYLLTLPLIIFYFGNLSLSSPLTNILILPVLPILMALGFLFAIISLIYLPLAQIFSWPILIILKYITFIVRSLAQIPYFSFSFGRVDMSIIIIAYALLTFWLLRIYKISFQNLFS